MEPFRILTASEQVAEHLRGQLVQWRRADHVPGVIRLAGELGVGKDTVEAALRQLEKEGLIQSRGRRRRRTVTSKPVTGNATLRLVMLTFELPGQTDQWVRDLQQFLTDAGYFVELNEPAKARTDRRQIQNRLNRARADAWIAVAATTEVLTCLAETGLPTLAVAGGWPGSLVAGVVPDKDPALDQAMEILRSLGHQRISMLTRSRSLTPELAGFARRFIRNLETQGIPTGPFNLPAIPEDPDGLLRVLEGLFGLTPPAALIVDEAKLFFAVQQFLLNRGLRVPDDVSLICTDDSPDFAWCRPSVAHIRWDFAELARHALRWARHVERGRDDRRQRYTSAEFVAGGTVGPARPGRGSDSGCGR